MTTPIEDSRKVTFTYGSTWLRWIAGKELSLETRADDEFGRGRKARWVTNVIPVPVTSREIVSTLRCLYIYQ